MNKSIYVIGHKNPDSDSICSSIAYAYLKNKVTNENHIPVRIGDINRETEFILNYFNVEQPEFIPEVKTQVKDIEISNLPTVTSDLSLKNAWEIMKQNKETTLLISDDSKLRLTGLLTNSDITWSYMDVYDNNTVAVANTPYKNILAVLEGKLIIGDINDTLHSGNVMIGAMNPDAMENFIKVNDIVIVGNRYDSQVCAIEIGAQCIIVTGGMPVSNSIKNMAKAKDCAIITTKYDTYTVARLINQSIPIRHVMKTKDLITFSLDEHIDDVKEVIINNRYRNYPVVDENYRAMGTISRASLLNMKKKRVILMDHNERSQAVEGLEQAEVLEIIDHHRIGDVQTMGPVYFRNQPVGSTSTIVAMIFKEKCVEIPDKIAGLLCSAILSDTLIFRSPTCTEADIDMANQLAKIANIDIDNYATEMFKAGSRLLDKNNEDIFYQDYKLFYIGDIKIGIGQVNAIDKGEIQILKERMLNYTNQVYDKGDLDIVIFMITDILAEGTHLLYVGHNKEMVCRAFSADAGKAEIYLPGIMSRKKQVIPALINEVSP